MDSHISISYHRQGYPSSFERKETGLSYEPKPAQVVKDFLEQMTLYHLKSIPPCNVELEYRKSENKLGGRGEILETRIQQNFA